MEWASPARGTGIGCPTQIASTTWPRGTPILIRSPNEHVCFSSLSRLDRLRCECDQYERGLQSLRPSPSRFELAPFLYPTFTLTLDDHDKLLVRFKTLTNVMIQDALKVSRDRKGDSDLEVVAMDNTGEPVYQGFETLEGIEMVPGTVHLIDS
jgi:hypothetical protein